VLATESKGLARQFKAFSGIDSILLPHVTEWRDTPFGTDATPKGGKIVLGTYGFTRYDKGTDLLQQALLILISGGMPSGCHFLIQWTSGFNLPNGQRAEINSILAQRSDIEYFGAFRTEIEFRERMAATDIMILPYRKQFYFEKLSRVAIDAAEAGMPIVYPIGTWLETFVSQYGAGVSFCPDDPESLASALLIAIRDFPALKATARDRAPAVRHDFSSQSFFDILSKLPSMK
jgi:glycosyltransferase involved in cell wall biosynthesis